MAFIHKMNEAVADSIVGKYFKVRERNSTFSLEMRAGVVTFLTVAYILAVNSNILADTGGTCSPSDCTGPLKGLPGCKFTNDPGFEQCVADTKKSLITVTAAVSIIATVLTGVAANMPLALCPGMGLNAYFTYTVVGYRGTRNVRYEEALAAIFIEGFIFMILGVTGVRGHAIRLVPRNIMLATSAGIGLFLAFIGLQQAEGIGLIAFEPATLVTLGGCPLADRAHMYTVADPDSVCSFNATTGVLKTDLGARSPNHFCLTNKMRSAPMWLGIAGGLMMVVMLARKVKGAVMIGILFVTVISWIPTKGNKAAYLGKWSEIAGGADRLKYFKKVVDVPDASMTAGKLDFGAFGTAELWVALVTMLYVDFLDTTGTLYSMANFMATTMPGFIDEKTKEFPGMLAAFTVDGLSISICGLLGTSPTTAYIESATGIKEGGRTGLTALMVAFCFFIALFFTPILASIPPYATGPALILVGALMMENIKDIEWHNPIKAVPAFLTITVMPLTYSIAYGVIAGICSAIFLEAVTYGLNLAFKSGSDSSSEADVKEVAKDVDMQ